MNLCPEYAIKYQKLGWSVIPIRSGTKKPHVKWEPFEKKRPTEKQIEAWWQKWPDAQLAVITGKVSNFVALDFDSPEAVENFESSICQLPETIRQETGKPNHFHYLFKYPPNTKNLPNFAKKIADVDLRGDGGYILVAPSIHPNKNQYKWDNIDPTEMGLDDLLEMPEDILEFCKGKTEGKAPPRKVSKTKPGWVEEALVGVKIGKRDQTCTKLAGYYMRLFEGDKQQTRDILYSWNMRNEPPMDNKDVDKVVGSIGKRHKILALSDIIGFEIFQIEKIRRDTHDNDYLFYLEEGTARMTSEDVLVPGKFTKKIFELTDTAPNLTPYSRSKKSQWLQVVSNAMKEATVIQASIDETLAESVVDAINQYIKTPSDDVNLLDRRPIVVDGTIFVKIKALRNHIRTQQGEKITPKEVGNILRNNLRFKNERTRIGGTQERLWTKPLEKWKWL